MYIYIDKERKRERERTNNKKTNERFHQVTPVIPLSDPNEPKGYHFVNQRAGDPLPIKLKAAHGRQRKTTGDDGREQRPAPAHRFWPAPWNLSPYHHRQDP